MIKNTQKAAYDSLAQVIENLGADRVDENTVLSLKSMLNLASFEPIRTIIENKIIEIGKFLTEQEKKKTEALNDYDKFRVNQVEVKEPTFGDEAFTNAEILNEYTKYMKDKFDDDCEFEVRIPECDQLR